jgi:alkylation response protein AidB-like acyl-CoA dehydrogenase
MDFRLTPAEERWQEEVRSFLKAELPPGGAGLHDSWTESDEAWEASRRFTRRLGEKGWLAMAWPKEYGGQARSYVEQMIFNEEMSYHRAPMGRAGLGTGLIGPTIMLHGTDEQKARYLAPIARGDEVWCQGFSEPNAGSDLASLQTRAVADGDDFVISGQKIWQSAAHHADFSLLGARTDPAAPKHRGVTLFIVPLRSPGVTIRPIIDLRGTHYFNEVFFDNVRVPRTSVVGEVNRGWYAMTTTLDFERSNVGQSAEMRRNWEDVLSFVRESAPNRLTPAERRRLRIEMAERRIEIDIARFIAYRVVTLQSRGMVPNYEASMSKLYGSELTQRLAATFLHLLGLYGALDAGSPRTALGGFIARLYLESPANTIRAGTSEIQRNIIATRGLGLPRG